MAIKNRQGKSQDFVPTKLVSGEFAVVQEGDENTADGSALYLATKAGSVKRIPFATEVEDLKTRVDDVVEDAREAIARAIDPTLTQSGKAADAKKTGDEIADLKSDLTHIFSDNAKTALLACLAKVAWTDEHGQDYYDTLASELFTESYPKITAVYNPSARIIYTDDALDSLKSLLIVKYYETKDSTGVTISANDYSLSGVLVEGNTSLRVSYDGMKTNVIITGVVDFYNIWSWSVSSGSIDIQGGAYEINQDDLTKYPSRLQYYANNTRRCLSVDKGKATAYWRNQTAQSTNFYPIPVPANANHVKFTMNPDGQYLAMNTLPFNSETQRYENAITENRISWQQFSSGVIEKDITNPGNLFMCCNFKYDSGGSAYPSDPTEIGIEFSEV